jgi:hypothetical protein
VAAALNIKYDAAAKQYLRLKKAINTAGLPVSKTATTTKKRKNAVPDCGSKKGKKKAKADDEASEKVTGLQSTTFTPISTLKNSLPSSSQFLRLVSCKTSYGMRQFGGKHRVLYQEIDD